MSIQNPAVRIDRLVLPLKGTMYAVSVTVHEPAKVERSLVCLHGVAGNSHDFDILAQFLVRHGTRVICPDMIGRGRSGYAANTAAYDVESYARLLASVIGEYGAKNATLLGNGWGGLISLALLSAANLELSGLILCNVPLHWTFAEDKAIHRAIAALETGFPDKESAIAYVLADPEFACLQPGLAMKFAEHRIRQSGEGYLLNCDEQVAASLRDFPIREFDFGRTLSDIDAEVLLLYSDMLANADQAELTPLLNRTRPVTVVDRFGEAADFHFTLPAQRLAILGFLTTVVAARQT